MQLPSLLSRYVVATVVTGAALALKLLLAPLVTNDEPALFFFAAVIVSAAFGGLGAGIFATVLGAFFDSYFFMAPYGKFQLNNAAQVLRLGMFMIEGGFISLICARMKSARANAERSAEESRELQQRILEVSDAQQRRIGHDLHDGLGQHLTGMALLARSFEERLAAVAPAQAKDASKLTSLAQSAVEWSHDLCRTLSPSEESTDLPEILRELAAKAENLFHIQCAYEQTGEIAGSNAGAQMHLYRIAQEAISNAVRHGKARNVRLRLESSPRDCVMEIIDDGEGIGPDAESTGGMGLRIMRYRARLIGASVDIQPHAPRGTIVSCRFACEGPE